MRNKEPISLAVSHGTAEAERAADMVSGAGRAVLSMSMTAVSMVMSSPGSVLLAERSALPVEISITTEITGLVPMVRCISMAAS